LNNPEVDGVVNTAVGEVLSQYLEENPKEAKKIVQKVVLSAEVRAAEAKARKALIDRKKILGGGGCRASSWTARAATATSELFWSRRFRRQVAESGPRRASGPASRKGLER
jgi:DNA gyrase/topoisomerase IV subunit B